MSEDIQDSGGFSKIFGILCVLVFILVILVNFYFLYFKKDYEFIVETPCDPNQEECFYRDCSIAESCPPNELSYFKRYYIPASDFNFCTDGDCANVCSSGSGICEQIICEPDEEFGEECVSPDSQKAPSRGIDL